MNRLPPPPPTSHTCALEMREWIADTENILACTNMILKQYMLRIQCNMWNDFSSFCFIRSVLFFSLLSSFLLLSGHIFFSWTMRNGANFVCVVHSVFCIMLFLFLSVSPSSMSPFSCGRSRPKRNIYVHSLMPCTTTRLAPNDSSDERKSTHFLC